jgi:hypothetical protein
MSEKPFEPKWCKRCIELDRRPKVTVPTKSYCREHYNEYQRDLRNARKEKSVEWSRTHNEYGDPINEWDMTESEMQTYMDIESERLEQTYGPHSEP